MFTNLNLTDMETCYKAFRTEVIRNIQLKENRFGFEPEFTAKVAHRGYRIYEVPISYHGRTYQEGKKIGWKDGVKALWCILRYGLFLRRGLHSAGARRWWPQWWQHRRPPRRCQVRCASQRSQSACQPQDWHISTGA